MANTKSANKSHKQSLRRRVFNLRRLRTMRETTKKFLKLIEKKDKEGAEKMLPALYKAIDKAKKRGIIKKNNASRKKSCLSKKLTRI